MPEGKMELPNEGEGKETKTGRPTEADFKNKIEGYIVPLKSGMGFMDPGITRELEEMANGGGDPYIREAYYKGWTNEDFGELLSRLDKALEELGEHR